MGEERAVCVGGVEPLSELTKYGNLASRGLDLVSALWFVRGELRRQW
jgi:hypothetical protein